VHNHTLRLLQTHLAANLARSIQSVCNTHLRQDLSSSQHMRART
jgi:hypothetical protein